MLDKYMDKTVKVIVSSDSGVSTSTSVAGNSTVSSIIQVFGKLIGSDKEFIEIETASIVYFNNSHTSTSFVDTEQASTMIISKKNIISIIMK
jgi:hypothetical protein